jgi:dTDP-4-dehydrorhamnose 3,5-epimerase
MSGDANLFDTTLAAATKDAQFVTPEGVPVRKLTHGVTIRELPTHVDQRGSVMELFDTRWNWHPEPLVFSYCFTLRPGVVKGWNLHKAHEDRYVLIQGELELVLYDPRGESPTVGEVCRLQLTPYRRCIVNIPRNVWHADHNIGAVDVLVVNFPTASYDHANPDKYRLPIDTDLIPYRFPEGTQGG